MNFRLVVNQLGLLVVVLSAIIAAVAGWALWEWLGQDQLHEKHAALGLVIAAGGGLVIGGGLWIATRHKRLQIGRREALLLVGLSWLLGAAIAAAPFSIWAHLDGPLDHPFRNFVDCYFEAMSGLTTTGASILTDIEAIPRSLLLWRSLTHWLGGLGIVVLFVAVLPSLGVGGKRLFRVEAPGPEPEGVRPHIRDTARVLWLIYLGLTLAQIVALYFFTELDLFRTVCVTFGTLATGGFSTRNASIGAYDSLAVETIILGFMVIAGANFGVYYQLCRRRIKAVFGDVELRVYLGMLIIGSLIVIGALWLSPRDIGWTTGPPTTSDFGSSVRAGLFTTVSVQTTTGFGNGDFNTWPFLAKAVLVMLMFVGGSAGSTSGGIKVIRVWIMMKVMISELEQTFRPNVVRPLRVGAVTIDADTRRSILAYILVIVLIFVGGSGAIMLLEQHRGAPETCSYTTAATATIATLCTIGPGLDRVGATQNYGWFTDTSKIVLCILMSIGRLEVFAILVLFMPRFWRTY